MEELVWNYLNIRDPLSNKSSVESSHSRDKTKDQFHVSPMQNFATNENIVNFCLRVVRLYVINNPLASWIYVFQGGDVSVRGGDGDRDSRIGEGLEDFWVDIKDLDTVNGGFGLDEVRHNRWRREVVADCAVVNSDGVCGGGKLEEEEEEEEW